MQIEQAYFRAKRRVKTQGPERCNERPIYLISAECLNPKPFTCAPMEAVLLALENRFDIDCPKRHV